MGDPVVLTGVALVLVALALWAGASGERELTAVRLIFPRDIRPEQVVAFARSLSGLPSAVVAARVRRDPGGDFRGRLR